MGIPNEKSIVSGISPDGLD